MIAIQKKRLSQGWHNLTHTIIPFRWERQSQIANHQPWALQILHFDPAYSSALLIPFTIQSTAFALSTSKFPISTIFIFSGRLAFVLGALFRFVQFCGLEKYVAMHALDRLRFFFSFLALQTFGALFFLTYYLGVWKTLLLFLSSFISFFRFRLLPAQVHRDSI